MNTKRLKNRAAVALAVVLAVFFGSCENPYVQEILRGPTVLDNLALYTEEGVRYKLDPDFDSNILEYTTSVPYPTTVIVFEGFDHRDAEVKYRLSGDGVTYGEENSGGSFTFSREDYPWEGYVKVRVNRKHMDERTYTIHVIRISDAMLWDLEVWSKTGLGSDSGMSNALDPGYEPEKDAYLVRVNSQAKTLNLKFRRKEGVTVKWKSRLDGGTWSAETAIPPDPDAPDAPETGWTIDFPITNEKVEFEVTVSMEVPLPTPHTETKIYKIEVLRPFEVSIDPATAAAGFTCDIYGGGPPYRFAVGNVVSFNLKPPFGTTTSGVSYSYTDSGGPQTGSITPSDSHLYSLIMPSADLVISAVCTPVPASIDTNVRYVREGGAPYKKTETGAGDALSWVNATNDLQAVIDGFSLGAGFTGPVSQGNKSYEIWVAGGTYTPDWSTLGSADWYSGAPSAAPAHRWTFVLKNGVRIYGGFDGTEQSQADREARDWRSNRTTLSGELGDRGTNRHAVVAAGISGFPLYAHLEGLAVHAGYNVLGYEDQYTINNNQMTTYMSNPDGPGSSLSPTGNILYMVNAYVLCKDVDFDHGQAHYASGIAVWANARLALINCTVRRSQSAGYGSALTLLNSTSRLVMIGGGLSLNWDAGGVFAMSGGQALLVNVRIDGNHENPVKVSNAGQGYFVNTSITGNRGTTNSDADRTITTGNTYSADTTGEVRLYNSVVIDNFLQTYGDNVWFYNTMAPDSNGLAVSRNSTTSLVKGPLENRGNNNYYPLTSGGTWNTSAPGYSIITDVQGSTGNPWKTTAEAAMKAALLKDGTGNSRFNGTIDLGAEEQ
jgi:hypothetical protein